jgi:hypothetical protein
MGDRIDREMKFAIETQKLLHSEAAEGFKICLMQRLQIIQRLPVYRSAGLFFCHGLQIDTNRQNLRQILLGQPG